MMFFDDIFYGPSSLSFARASAPALAYHSYYAPRPRRHVYQVPVRYVDPYYEDDFFGFSAVPRVQARRPLNMIDLVDVVDILDPARAVLARKAAESTTNSTPQSNQAPASTQNPAQTQGSKAPSMRAPKKSDRRPSTTTAVKSQSPKKPRTEIFVATFDNENGWRYYKKAADSEQLQQVEGPQLDASTSASDNSSDGVVKQIEQRQHQDDPEMPALEEARAPAVSQISAAAVPVPVPVPVPEPERFPVSVAVPEVQQEQQNSVPYLSASFHNGESAEELPKNMDENENNDDDDDEDDDDEDYEEYDQEGAAPAPTVVPEPRPSSSTASPDWSQELELLKAVGFDDREHLIPLLEEIMGTPSTSRAEAQQGLKRVLARLLLQ